MSGWIKARLAALLTVTTLLTACGGGGGDDAPATGRTLGGTIQAADVSTVDSDTNDPQQTGFVPNDTPGTAQRITSPLTVVGSVNHVRKGPSAGRNYTVGDEDDWFRLTLRAGQVVELFVGLDDSSDNDADLCVISTDAGSAGCSLGVTERECVQAATDGDYYVLVNEYSSASVYNLRISAPGAGTPCSTMVHPVSAHVPGQLIASHAGGEQTASRMQARALAQAGGARVHGALGGAADVIDLPADASARRAALAAFLPDIPSKRALASQAVAASPVAASDHEAVLSMVRFHRYAKAVRTAGGYAAVEPNWLMETTASNVGSFPPGDVRYSSQRWHYEQIALPAAMQVLATMTPQPTQRPLVAVLDDGVMLDHPDLAPQLAGRGHTFASVTRAGDSDRADGETLAASSRDSFHGSHVAGTVAAATFDSGSTSFGAGVAPMAQILPVRVFGPGGGATSLDVAEGILYASRLPNRSGSLPARRADVINMSLGARTYVACPQAYQDVITRARNAGVIVVAAAGNSGDNAVGRPARVSAPANCSGVYAVAATDALRRQTHYSNSGDELALAAPGGDGAQRTSGNGTVDSVFSAWGEFDATGARRAGFRGIDGTSMAAPHVAGVMALMRWVNPNLTVAQVDGLLQSGALSDDLGAGGKDGVYGYGVVNARKAVEAAIASRGGRAPGEALVVATPSTLDFGSVTTQLTLRLASPGTTSERITGITSDSAAVTVTAASVNASGLGDYTVRVDRSRAGSAAAEHFPRLSVRLSSGRSITVQLAFTVVGSSGAGNVGPIYVLAHDPDSGQTLQTVATYANGRYTWQIGGYGGSRVIVLAGTDLDSDDYICSPAEVCGGYPVLGPAESMTIDLDGDRTDLDFTVAPVTDFSAASLSAGRAAGTPAPTLRRRRNAAP